MSQVCLILGGTSVLERSIQNALGSAPIVVGSVDEVVAELAKHPGAVVVLGPTFRRSLAAVGQIRPEGRTQPPILVIYRDDQKDEVKRHQRGKTLADKYVLQSRAAKDLEPAIKALIAADVEEIDAVELLDDDGDETLAKLDGAALELVEDDAEDMADADIEMIDDDEAMPATIQMDVVTLSADDALEEEPTTPMPGRATAHNEVLGELDVEELDGDELMETLEPEAIELTDEGDDLESLEEVLDEAVLEEETEAEDEAQALDSDDLREETAHEHDSAIHAELQGLRDKLQINAAQMDGLEAQNGDLQAKLGKQNSEIAALQEQLKSARSQIATLQTKMIDCRIQAEEAAGIVKALANKLG